MADTNNKNSTQPGTNPQQQKRGEDAPAGQGRSNNASGKDATRPGEDRASQASQPQTDANRTGPASGNGRGNDLGHGQQGDARQAQAGQQSETPTNAGGAERDAE